MKRRPSQRPAGFIPAAQYGTGKDLFFTMNKVEPIVDAGLYTMVVTVRDDDVGNCIDSFLVRMN